MSKLKSCRFATSDGIAARDSVSRKAQQPNHKPEGVSDSAQKGKRSCCSLYERYDEIEGRSTVGTIRGSVFGVLGRSSWHEASVRGDKQNPGKDSKRQWM